MSGKSRGSLPLSCLDVTTFLFTWLLAGSCINAENGPEIVNDIQNLTKSAGEWGELDCTVKNRDVSRKVYWEQEFNGQMIQLATDDRLVINNPVGGEYPNNKTKFELDVIYNTDQTYTYRLRVNRLEATDAGVYVCSLVKVAGSAQPISKQGSITIRGVDTDAPQIVNIIGTIYGRITQSATLPCLVANKGSNRVIWKRSRDNLDITSDTTVVTQNPSIDGTKKFSVSMKEFNSGKQFELTVNSLGNTDNGTYECRVMVEQSVSTSATGQIYVQVPPEISSPTPENITIAQGGSTDLTCTATGSPYAPVMWQRADFGNLPNGEQKYTGSTVRISNARKEQRGLYKCQASNGVYPSDEKLFRIHVRFDPIATSVGQSATQASGFPVTISCVMEGYPEVTPSWNKLVGGSRTPISPSNDYIITEVKGNGVTGPIDYSEYSLRIERLKEADFGDYECVGRSAGGASSSAVIKIIKSDVCVGSGCPGTQPSPVTEPNSNGSTCKGDNCTGGSRKLHSQIVIYTVIASVILFLR